MKSLSESQKNKRITDINLPGSHNSAAYRFNGNYLPGKIGGVHVGFLEFLRKMKIGAKVMKDWTLTQDWSIKEQLENGIRIFDLNVSFASNCGSKQPCGCCGCDKELLITHKFSCLPLVDFLHELKAFVDENPSEIVIVLVKPDFVHRQTMTQDAWDEFLELVGTLMETTLQEKVNTHIPTIKDCQESGKRVFFNIEFTESPRQIPYFVWTTLKYHLMGLDLYDIPTKGVIKRDIWSRILKSCCHEKQSLRNFSKTTDEYFDFYQKFVDKTKINVWWMNFPSQNVINEIISLNYF